MDVIQGEVLVNIISSETLYSFRPSDGFLRDLDVRKGGFAFGGYGDFYGVKGDAECALFYCMDQKIFFHFRESYELAAGEYSAEIIHKMFGGNRFVLRFGGSVVVNYVYRSMDPESDVFQDLVAILKISPRSKLLSHLNCMAQYYSEADVNRRSFMDFVRARC